MRIDHAAVSSRLPALAIEPEPCRAFRCVDSQPPTANRWQPIANSQQPTICDGIDILHAVTSSISLNLLRGQPTYLRDQGFRPGLLCGPGAQVDRMRAEEDVPIFEIAMQREIAPLRDLVSTVRIWRLLRRLHPRICNVGTPKAGLLVGLAAWLSGVPFRVYTLRGLRFETATGLKRRVLVAAETISCACAHRVICVSASLRTRAIAAGIVSPEKAIVLASGSSNGVDVSRFAAGPERPEQADRIRRELGLALGRPVLGFVGRLTRDKGITELLEAFAIIRQRFPDAVLLLVGSFEAGDPVPQAVRTAIEQDPSVIRVEFSADHSAYYLPMDVFVLPTHREGFPNAVLEAQASGKPVVTTRATGAIDSIVDGVTGLLVPVSDPAALANAVLMLLSDRKLAERMGQAGNERVHRDFQREVVWEALAGFYRTILPGRHPAAGSPLLSNGPGLGGLPGFPPANYQPRLTWRRCAMAFCKRTLDLLVSAMGLVFLSPLLFAVALAIRIRMGLPVFFRQLRPGYRARPFMLVKFRTMTNDSASGSANGMQVDTSFDAVRLTPLGRFLRRFSLDELPQLWNVLCGNMSLVGPRPLLMEYLERYTPEQARRHDVKPGITGWTQINGRNANTWEQKFALDVWYVDHWSFWLDLRILAVTLWKVIRQEGISQPGHATMTKFGAGRNS